MLWDGVSSMSNNRVSRFDDETILSLFGAQAAEDDRPDQLKSYFIRNKAYERAGANIPLRIIVGHKGVGKSALLKMLFLQDASDKVLSIWLQPNDISRAWSVTGNFVEKVEGIKKNILSIIAEKSFDELEIFGKQTASMPGLSSARSLFRILTKAIQEEGGPSVEASLAKEFNNNGKINIYIDDIDRGWAATPSDIENISALINASRDLVNQDVSGGLRFRIGIRTDAYNLVREHDESGDKFEPYRVPITWTNHEILVLMAKRVSNYFSVEFDDGYYIQRTDGSQLEVARFLQPVISEKFEGAGHWANRPIHNVLLSLTRRRPRDLVKLLSGAAQVSDKNGRTIITTRDLTDSFPDYSKGRIADLVSEFRSELPEIEQVVYSLRPSKKDMQNKEKRYLYTNDELIGRLNALTARSNIYFKNGKKATGTSLAEFLFKIDFVIARREVNSIIERYYYEDHSKLQSSKASFGMQWEVHPAYRWALNPQKVHEIIGELDV